MYRYYSTQRPIGLGCLPSKPKPVNVVNFDYRKYCNDLMREAWGYVEYDTPLDNDIAEAYDLSSDTVYAYTVDDCSNLPGTRVIPKGTKVKVKFRFDNGRSFVSITAPNGITLDFVDTKHLREA